MTADKLERIGLEIALRSKRERGDADDHRCYLLYVIRSFALQPQDPPVTAAHFPVSDQQLHLSNFPYFHSEPEDQLSRTECGGHDQAFVYQNHRYVDDSQVDSYKLVVRIACESDRMLGPVTVSPKEELIKLFNVG